MDFALGRRASSDKVRLVVHTFRAELPKNFDRNPFSQAIGKQSATSDTGIAFAIFDFGSVELRKAQAFDAVGPDCLLRR